jgi:hypothetical protein
VRTEIAFSAMACADSLFNQANARYSAGDSSAARVCLKDRIEFVAALKQRDYIAAELKRRGIAP